MWVPTNRPQDSHSPSLNVVVDDTNGPLRLSSATTTLERSTSPLLSWLKSSRTVPEIHEEDVEELGIPVVVPGAALVGMVVEPGAPVVGTLVALS